MKRCFQSISISDCFQVVVLRPLKVHCDSLFVLDGVRVKNVNIPNVFSVNPQSNAAFICQH